MAHICYVLVFVLAHICAKMSICHPQSNNNTPDECVEFDVACVRSSNVQTWIPATNVTLTSREVVVANLDHDSNLSFVSGKLVLLPSSAWCSMELSAKTCLQYGCLGVLDATSFVPGFFINHKNVPLTISSKEASEFVSCKIQRENLFEFIKKGEHMNLTNVVHMVNIDGGPWLQWYNSPGWIAIQVISLSVSAVASIVSFYILRCWYQRSVPRSPPK